MRILELLFNHKKKILDVKEAIHQPEVHNQKNKLSGELLKLHNSAIKIEREAIKMRQTIDTATRIAHATGGLKIE